MREIKFRAWDKEEKRWYQPIYEAYKGKLFELLIDINGQILIRTTDSLYANDPADPPNTDMWRERFILMQFTGLKDKNGKEIYEGDIIEYLNTSANWYAKGIIEYEQSNCEFVLKDIKYGNAFLEVKYSGNHNIVGNIYENPNLLKESES